MLHMYEQLVVLFVCRMDPNCTLSGLLFGAQEEFCGRVIGRCIPLLLLPSGEVRLHEWSGMCYQATSNKSTDASISHARSVSVSNTIHVVARPIHKCVPIHKQQQQQQQH